MKKLLNDDDLQCVTGGIESVCYGISNVAECVKRSDKIGHCFWNAKYDLCGYKPEGK